MSITSFWGIAKHGHSWTIPVILVAISGFVCTIIYDNPAVSIINYHPDSFP